VAGRGPAGAVTRWLVDASNVIGSRPDGWWRDREGATARLIDALRAFAGSDDVVVVLDAGPAAWAGREGAVEVAIAPRRGRNAADDEIARRLEADDDPGSRGPVRWARRSSARASSGAGSATEATSRI
jgi:hypothetical protein